MKYVTPASICMRHSASDMLVCIDIEYWKSGNFLHISIGLQERFMQNTSDARWIPL